MATDGLSSRGRAFESLFFRALTMFQDDNTEECERICRMLLTYADLGDYHKAGCHLLLGFGKDNYLFHAEQAVYLYENMFVVRRGGSYDGVQEPTHEQRQLVEECLQHAHQGLALARSHHKAIQKKYAKQVQRFFDDHGRNATDLELVEAHHWPTRAERDAYFEAVDTALHQFHQDALAAQDEDEDEEDEGEDTEDELDRFTFGSSVQASRQSSAMPGMPSRVPGGFGATPLTVFSDTTGAPPAPSSNADANAAAPFADKAAFPSSDAAAPPASSDRAASPPPTSDAAAPSSSGSDSATT